MFKGNGTGCIAFSNDGVIINRKSVGTWKICILFIILFSNTTLADEPLIKYWEVNERFYQSASVLVMDADTGEVLFETEGFTLRYPASITKVMTALLVLEHEPNMDARVIFSEHAVDIPWYASRMGIVEGETISVLEALYGIMLPSGNEVARALAEHISGSVPDFVNLMNRRAWELGAYQTRFVNPCGLPGDGQFVTAYDVSLIMREAIKHPLFLQIINTAYFELSEIYGEPRRLRNSNRMVRPNEAEFNPDIIGGKTGFTNAAQHTLVSYARRGDIGLIITVLYAPSGATFTDTTALMDYVFNSLTEEPISLPLPETPEIQQAPQQEEPQQQEPQQEEPQQAPLQQEPLPPPRQTSDAEAAVAAATSLGIVGFTLGLVWWFRRRIINF